MRHLASLALAALAACAPLPPDSPPARAVAMLTGPALPPMQTFPARPFGTVMRPNSEVADDFLDLAFRMESGRAIPIMTRFEGPISVRVTGQTTPSLVPDLRALLDRMRNEAGLDIFLTGAPQASITIETIPSAVLQQAVPRAACFVVPRVSSWDEFLEARRTPQVDWATLERRDRAAIFVPSDVAPQEIRDCMHEELAQAVGPLNDLYRLPDSVFNDDNIHAVLTPFDMLILRAYYAPELSNGMTRGQAAVRLPGLLARLNPAGDRSGGRPQSDTSRDWIDAIETALTSGLPANRRRSAAETAVRVSSSLGWGGARQGFAYYALGRLQVGNMPGRALEAFEASARSYAASPVTSIHTAHVAVQLSAFALASGDGARTLSIVDPAIPVAAAHQNAALLATLLMFKAEALELEGRFQEAEVVRLDSLGWARYGFGSDTNIRARQREIAALNPGRES